MRRKGLQRTQASRNTHSSNQTPHTFTPDPPNLATVVFVFVCFKLSEERMMEAQVQESVQLLISGGTSISQRGETNINKAGSERDVRHCLHFQGRKYTWEMIFQLKKINMEKISFTNNINQHINHSMLLLVFNQSTKQPILSQSINQ